MGERRWRQRHSVKAREIDIKCNETSEMKLSIQAAAGMAYHAA